MVLFLFSLIFILVPIHAFAYDQAALTICNIVVELTQGPIVLGIAAISIIGLGYYILMKGVTQVDKNDAKLILRVSLALAIVISAEKIVSVMIVDDGDDCDSLAATIESRDAAEEFASWLKNKAEKNAKGCDAYGSCGSYTNSFLASSFKQVFYNKPQLVDNLVSSDNYEDFFETTNGSGGSISFAQMAKNKAYTAISYYRKKIAVSGEAQRSEGEIAYVNQQIIDALQDKMLERSTQVIYN